MGFGKKLRGIVVAAAIGLALLCCACDKKSGNAAAGKSAAETSSATKRTPTPTPTVVPGAATRVAAGITTRTEEIGPASGGIRPIGASAATQTNPFFAEKYLSPEERIKRRQERILQSLQR